MRADIYQVGLEGGGWKRGKEGIESLSEKGGEEEVVDAE